MKKGFTLTEIVISIVILGLLAGIILVNVFDTKDKAIATHIEGNIAALQRATDAYYIEEEHYPTEREPSFGRPEKLLLDRLSPKYIHKADLDAVKHQTYTVDVDGRVWGSTATSPEVVFETQEGVRWTPSERAVAYDVYQDLGRQADVNHRLKKVVRLEGLPETDQYLYKKKGVLLSAVDRFGKATAPTMVGTSGFVPRIDFEGSFDYIVEGDETFILDSFKPSETKPEGTSISYRFTTYDEKGDVLRKDLEAFPEGEKANKIKVSIEMKGAKNKKPSLKGLFLYYHYLEEEMILLTPIPLEDLPKGLMEECEVSCQVYNIPTDLKESHIASIRPQFIPSTSNDAEDVGTEEMTDSIPYEVRGSYVVFHTEGGKWPEHQMVALKDKSLSIGVPTEYAEDLDEGESVHDPKSASSVVEERGWTTIDSQFVVAGSPSGGPIHWIEANIEDEIRDKENTKIVYRYSYLEGDAFVGGYQEISEVPDSRSIRLTANLMVKTKSLGKVTEPSFKSATFRTEKGAVSVDSVKPTVVIRYDKTNNGDRDVISTASTVSWKYLAFDPRGKSITDVRWSGDFHDQYPSVGKKTVYLEVKNSSGYWSEKAMYTFDVKNEMPIAKIDEKYSVVRTGEPIDWEKADLSLDQDGDGIVKREWQGVSPRYDTEGISNVARLRVQDSEGNWSEWAELPYSTCKDVCFKGLSSPKAWDGATNTFEWADGATVTWTGRLENRMLSFDVYQASSDASFVIKDKNGTPLSFFDVNKSTYVKSLYPSVSQRRTEAGRTLVSVIVPEGAASIVFNSSRFYVYEFLLSNGGEVATPKNLKSEAGVDRLSLSWEGDAAQYIVLDKEMKMVETTKTKNVVVKGLYSNQAYRFHVLAVDASGTMSRPAIIETATLDDGINFRGVSSKIIDQDSSTFDDAVNGTLTWDGDISGRKIKIEDYYGDSDASMYFEDANGNKLKMWDLKGNVMKTVAYRGTSLQYGVEGQNIVSVIVPEGAKKLRFSSSRWVMRSLSISRGASVRSPENLNAIPSANSAKLAWDASLEAVKYILFDVDGNYKGETTTNDFTVSSLYSNKSYSYFVSSVDETGTVSKKEGVILTTLNDGVNFRGVSPNLFDNDSKTLFEAANSTVTWDGDISGRTLMIEDAYGDSDGAFWFKDENRATIKALNLKNNQMESPTYRGPSLQYGVEGKNIVSVVVPNGAKSILFHSSNWTIRNIWLKK